MSITMWKDSGVTWKSAQSLIFTIVDFLKVPSLQVDCVSGGIIHAEARLAGCPPGLILMWHRLVLRLPPNRPVSSPVDQTTNTVLFQAHENEWFGGKQTLEGVQTDTVNGGRR